MIGRELQAVGVNLVLGPNLDVFDQSNIDKVGTLGAFSFGGDPYWVSQMGRSYITGVHAGGQGRVATVARHFPGQGNSDRLPDEEVATIQKSLDEMRRVALPPFVAVTRQASSIVDPEGDPGATDMLMTSHMRYSGLQGGGAGRITPLSLAPELRTILAQEGLDTWHDEGGVIVSNVLGVPAIRRFYSADSQSFFNRRVALDAFMAGNDLLYLADISLDDRWETEKANIKETIGFFQDRYSADPDFAARVDASVRRILRLKLGLYRDAGAAPSAETSAPQTGNQPLLPVIPLSDVMVTESDLDVLGGEPRSAAEASMGQVARNAITILYPDPAAQTEPLPPAFRSDDRILIFSDSRLLRECATCPAEAAIGPDELANIIIGLYGSEATGQIDPNLLTSLTFADLSEFLDSQAAAAMAPTAVISADVAPTVALTPALATGGVVTNANVLAGITAEMMPLVENVATAIVQNKNAKTQALIQSADWVIFAMLDVAPARYPTSDAVPRFLREYRDQLADQKLVVLALNAPYFLDATEMSQLTTYFGVYGKTQPFLESAVRALFRSFTVVGAPPVDVPGTRFSSLAARLEPDPALEAPLRVEDSDGAVIAQNDKPAGETAIDDSPVITEGATLRVQVGPVIDHNNHPVPDGTLVSFQIRFEGQEVALAVEPALTRDGTATRDVPVEGSGVLRVAATTGNATTGPPLAIVVRPLPAAATEAPATVSAITGAAQEAAGDRPIAPDDRVNLATLLIALFTILVTLSLLLIVQVRILPRGTLVHNLLWAVIFGLAGYVLYGLGLFPGGNWLYANISMWGAVIAVFVPMLLSLLWLQLRGMDR